MGLIKRIIARTWKPYSSSDPHWDHWQTRRRRERREERTQIGHARRDRDDEGGED